jgi:hypothetical protein
MMNREGAFWIVVDSNFPTNVSHKHTTEENAKQEARRLAKKTNGKFIVLQAIYAVEVDNLIETQYEDIPF